VVLLLYIEWRLAIGVLILIPPIILGIRYFSNRMHVLSHHTMEQQAAVSSRLEESLSTFSLIKSFSTETRTIKRLVSEMKKVLHLSLEQSALTSVASLAIDAVPGIAVSAYSHWAPTGWSRASGPLALSLPSRRTWGTCSARRNSWPCESPNYRMPGLAGARFRALRDRP